ncbi:MAG: DegQ family serine endoprotease [Candidatus Binatia bacterium]
MRLRPRPLSLFRSRTLAAAALGGLLGSLLTLQLASWPSPDLGRALAGATAFLETAPAEAHYPSVDLAEVAEKATASVVNISSTKVLRRDQDTEDRMSPFMDDPFFRRFFQLPPGQGIPQERRAQSLGSGVIVDDDGIVLTNNHVVDGADEIKITLADNREFDAELVGADPQSDVAVVRIKGSPSGLRAIPFGDSSKLRLADTVLAIGNPFGVGQTVTMGIVSATGRANLGIADYEDFIQTDAAINPGNSGGALLNVRGELVGINTAIVSRTGGYQGIGFAIPSNMARSIMTSLQENGRVERGWLGVAIQNLDRELAEAMGIDQAHGVLVADVTEDGPAEKAGIRRGDVILSIAGQDVKSTGELRNLVASNAAGKTVTVSVMRGKKSRDIDVELGALAADKSPAAGPSRETASGLLAGLAVADLSKEARARFDIPGKIDEGALVTRVEPGSAPARAGIQPGDVLIQVDQNPVAGADDFRRHAGKLGEAPSVLLLVARESGTIFVLVKK